MSYQLYTTRAVVLGGYNVGEAHRHVLLLTEQFGLVRATARSMREARSKLRPALADYMLSSVTLVRGRDVWRITGAREIENPYHALAEHPNAQAMLARLARLLRRLLAGEEANPFLFRVVFSALSALVSDEENRRALAEVEALTVLRILYSLGYLAPDGQFESLVRSDEISPELVAQVGKVRRTAIRAINASLSESQL